MMFAFPVIAFTLADMVMFFLPICLIKAIVYQKELGVSQKESFVGAGLANAISSFIGSLAIFIPYFIVSLLVNFFLIQTTPQFFWKPSLFIEVVRGIFGGILLDGSTTLMLVLSNLMMLMFCFFMSVWVETKVLKKYFKLEDTGSLLIAVKKGNLYSYPLLVAGALLFIKFRS